MPSVPRLLPAMLCLTLLLSGSVLPASQAQAPERVAEIRERIDVLRGGPGAADRASAPTDARPAAVQRPTPDPPDSRAPSVTPADLRRLESRLLRRMEMLIDEAYDRTQSSLSPRRRPTPDRSPPASTDSSSAPGRDEASPSSARPAPSPSPSDTAQQPTVVAPEDLDTAAAVSPVSRTTPDTVREAHVVEVERAFFDAGVFRAFEVNFAFGQTTLLPRAFRTLDAIGVVLSDYPDLRLQIDGHTDAVGSAAANEQLSVRRAQAVRQYLIDEWDLDPDRLAARGYGHTRPVASNETSAGRELNRRVEFVLLNPEAADRPRSASKP